MIRHLLSIRQTEILDLMIANDLTAEEVADNLKIEKTTVRMHLENIRELYNTSSTMVAVIKYMKECQRAGYKINSTT